MRFRRRPTITRFRRRPVIVEHAVRLPSRDDCPTCNAQRDELGRPPIGFCGPDCLGRKARDIALAMRGNR